MPPRFKASDSHASSGSLPLANITLFSCLAVIGCAVDLVTKEQIFSWRGCPPWTQKPILWVWEGYIGIQTATNSGGLFGLGQGFTWLLSLLSIAAALGIFYWLFLAKGMFDRLFCISLGLVMGGIMGNLYDRLGLWVVPGSEGERLPEVRDWILLRYAQFSWPNFNVADCLLVCGAILLMWQSFRTGHKSTCEPIANAPSSSSTEPEI